MVYLSERYWVGHNKLLDFHWGIFNARRKKAIAIKNPIPDAHFQRASGMGFFKRNAPRLRTREIAQGFDDPNPYAR